MASEFIDSLTKGGAGKEPVSPYFNDNWKDKKISGFGIPGILFLLISFFLFSVYFIELYLIDSKTLIFLSDLLFPYYQTCLMLGISTLIISGIFFALYLWDGKNVPHSHILSRDFISACQDKDLIDSKTKTESVKFKIVRNRKIKEAKIFFTIKSVQINELTLGNAFKTGADGFTRCSYIALEKNLEKNRNKYKYILILGFGFDYQPYGDDVNEY